MNERTKQGLKILEAAALLGVLGDALMRATPWGLNVLLWAGAIVLVAGVFLARRRRRALAGGGHALLLAAVLFAAAFAWRDSRALNSLAGAGLAVSLGLMAWRARGGRLRLAGVTDYARALLVACLNTFFTGFPSLFRDVRWREVPHSGWSRHLRSVGLGALISLPLLILFGGLLMSADAAFERMVGRLFFANHDAAFGHFLLILALSWVTGGFLRGLFPGREVMGADVRAVPATNVQAGATAAAGTPDAVGAPTVLKAEPVSLGIVEIGVTLGLLNLLFLAFILVQLSYFFGGANLVQASGGLTFSEYYRRGFFELVAVAALVLPLLLGMHWLLHKGNRAHERAFRLLAGAQVFMLFVIMASAVRRMLLYQSVYGLTEQRVYTTAFMGWLALVFLWFVATVLRGRREQFACGALVAGLLVIATLHVINPDALIVRVNASHARAGGVFDADYAASLSADAAPALLESLSVLREEERRIVAAGLLEEWPPDESTNDWRNWNWARSEKRKLVAENAGALWDMALPPQSLGAELTSEPPPPTVPQGTALPAPAPPAPAPPAGAVPAAPPPTDVARSVEVKRPVKPAVSNQPVSKPPAAGRRKTNRPPRARLQRKRGSR